MQHKEAFKGVFFLRQFVDYLKGDILSALMLSQIVFWYRPGKTGNSKLKVCRPDGTWWLAKSHRDWNDELGFTQDQTRRCLEVLKKAGLIETHTWGFQGKPTIHLRCTLISGKVLTESGLSALLQQVGCGVLPHKEVVSNPLASGTKAISNTENTTEITTYIKPATAVATPPPEKQVGEKASEEEKPKTETKGEVGMATSTEILERHKRKEPGSIEALWKKRMALYHPGFQKISPKERGQLKHIMNAAGAQTRDVLDYVFEHWLHFAQKARMLKGLATHPAMPTIGFLLTNIEVALQLIAQPQTLPKPSVQADQPPKEIQPAHQEDDETPHHLKLTHEEIMAEISKFSSKAPTG